MSVVLDREHPSQEEQFWQRKAPNSGRAPVFTSPEHMHEEACRVFEWLHNHPLKEQLVFHAKGVITKTTANKMRPFTMKGVCLALGISERGLALYATRSEEYAAVVQWIKDVIYTQKFEGAAAGLLNPTLIARDLGLAEKHELSGPDGGPIKTSAEDERAKLMEEAARLGIDLSALGF